jgi:reactive chlorine resistance protein C
LDAISTLNAAMMRVCSSHGEQKNMSTASAVYSAANRRESLPSGASGITRLYIKAAGLDRFGMSMLRLGLVIVLLWIGGLKFASYEADGIVPLLANSPFMSFLYHHPAPEYRQHMNREGQAVPANQRWNESNGTYPVSYGLGVIIVSLGIMIALYPVWPQVSAVGSFLLILMSLTTLSFLATTPEAWVPSLGDPHHGFPYLSGAGRLIVKDCIMLGAAILTMADAAKAYLARDAALERR